MYAQMQIGLREVFQTDRPVYIATGSGTAMMEAALRAAPPGRLLALVNGGFAQRFVTIARACDREVNTLVIRAGGVPSSEIVRDALGRASYSALSLVHSETSTGALTDVSAIAEVAERAGVAIIVDSVSGVGGAPLATDGWKLSCVVSASQKAIAAPPGLSFAVASEAFLAGASRMTGRGVYLDLVELDRHARNCETPSTPAASLFFALARQLENIRSEGIGNRWARHEAMRVQMESWVARTRCTTGVEIDLLARAGARSPTVSVVTLPGGLHSDALAQAVAERGFTIAPGYGALRRTTVRIGHMGEHTVDGLNACLDAVSDALAVVPASA